MTQIPGGLLAKRYGTKLVFGFSNFVVSAMCFIVPLAAYWDIRALIALRILQGFIAVGGHLILALFSPANLNAVQFTGSSMAIDASYGRTMDSPG